MFHVGQQVVCIDDSPTIYGAPSGLHRGRVYTVDGINERVLSDDGLPGLYIAGMPRHAPILFVDKSGRARAVHCSFRSTRFRPVVERQTSIEIFERMLTQVPKKETV